MCSKDDFISLSLHAKNSTFFFNTGSSVCNLFSSEISVDTIKVAEARAATIAARVPKEIFINDCLSKFNAILISSVFRAVNAFSTGAAKLRPAEGDCA